MGADTFYESPWLLPSSVALGALGLAVSYALRSGKRRPYSYPGDAIPKEQQLKADAAFRPGPKMKVAAGWRPRMETQPEGDLLPHQVSGQQVWAFDSGAGGEVFDFDPSANPNAGDRIFRDAKTRAWKGPKPPEGPCEDPLEAAKKGFAFYQMIQCDDGQWAGDYGGPHFLLPGFVIAAYITAGLAQVMPEPYWRAAEVYLRNHQQADGGWGTHLESPSTMFCSTLNYVALRLLGAPAEDPACVDGRKFLRKQGGVLYTAPWTKFWLCALGVYDFRGMAPVQPDLWLLPSWFPVHPGRFWCHCRMVYLPMCYIYGLKWSYDAAKDPVTAALRKELYAEGCEYDEIDWSKHMFSIADVDNYSPLHWMAQVLFTVLDVVERLIIPCLPFVRRQSLRYVLEYMRAEDTETNFLTIGPVSKALHMLTAWVAAGGKADPDAASGSKEFKAHVARLPAYMWVAEDGLKVQGYNGSMAWDTSFAVQAATEAGLQEQFPEMCAKAYGWLTREQVRILPDGDWRFWRQPIRGGWGFSTAEQAWPVSDTTAEAFLAVLALRREKCTSGVPAFPDQHCFDSVQFLLSYQSADGGWATYENVRGWAWYELLNPAIVFGSIMIDYSYIECSSSAMQALVSFGKQFPDHRAGEIKVAVQRGATFIEAMQRDDGSWYGCWGNCFTYGCWFGVEGLLCAGRPASCEPIQRCTRFLLSKQNADGGWGEDFASCFNREYASRDKLYGCDSGSTVVCTAWALLALMAAECEEAAVVRKGIQFLMRRQLPSGDWAQENISGVFNRSVGITYTAFRNVFPLWALGRFATSYAPQHKS